MVPGIIPSTVIRYLIHSGHERVLAGLPASVQPGRKLVAPAPFADVVKLFDRLAGIGSDALARYADHYVHRFPILSFAASHVVTQPQLYRALAFGWSRAWPMLRFEWQRGHDVGVLRARATVREDCRVLFRLATEVLTRLPSVIGQPPATVEERIAGTSQAQWIVRMAVSGPAGSLDDFDPAEIFAALHGDGLFQREPRVRDDWGLTDGEARVVLALAGGKSVAEIAAKHGVARETVRTQVKRAMAKAGVRRQVDLVLLAIG